MNLVDLKSREFCGYEIFEDGTIVGKNNRIMSPIVKKNGRREIKLTVAFKKRKMFIVGRLVYCVFNNIDYDELDKDLCVIHKDGDYSNINISNLELVHRKDLIQGDNHKSINVLTSKDVERIKMLYGTTDSSGYYSYRRLGRMFNVAHSNIKLIVDGKIWNEANYKL